MSLIEIVAVIFSLLCIWLAVKKHVLNWPAGIIGVTAYLILFYQVRLYADMLLQLIFIIQGFYGWYNWKSASNDNVEVGYLDTKKRIVYAVLILLVSAGWAFILITYTNASTPYVDAFVATVSLAANWLMAEKKTENWMLWILANVIYIVLFWYKELYLSSGIYVVFLVLAIKGLIDWSKKRDIKKDLY